MRQYLRHSILFSVISLMSHTAFADPYFANSGTPTASPSTTTPTKKINGFAVPTVLSPQDFSNKVDAINKQTENRISQEVAKSLPKPETTTASTARPSTPVAPTVTTQPQQPQQPVYSGFGAAPPAKQPTTPTKTAPQSGGWQIQY